VESIMVRWLERLWCVFEAVINFSLCVTNPGSQTGCFRLFNWPKATTVSCLVT